MDDYEFSETNRESSVEDAVVTWAENNGWIARAMQYRGRVGCRDYDLYGYGQIVMMEFKRRGRGVKGLSGPQANERKRLAEKGLTVHVVDCEKQGIAILKRVMRKPW